MRERRRLGVGVSRHRSRGVRLLVGGRRRRWDLGVEEFVVVGFKGVSWRS